jgi:nucleotide-binding universal stress UspA family protein
MSIREIYLAHELDAAWIIALWKAIHGGDPSPEKIAAQAIAALSQYIAAPAQTAFSFHEMKAQFAKLGVQVTERAEEEAERAGAKPLLTTPAEGEPEFRIHQYCFKFKGETFCTELPTLTHLPTAA